jgi:hypothetical protein
VQGHVSDKDQVSDEQLDCFLLVLGEVDEYVALLLGQDRQAVQQVVVLKRRLLMQER